MRFSQTPLEKRPRRRPAPMMLLYAPSRPPCCAPPSAGLARSRLTSSLVTLIGSSGVIAALPLGWQTAFASAAIAFVASAITLMITYVEDSSGGEGSLSRLREEMIGQI